MTLNKLDGTENEVLPWMSDLKQLIEGARLSSAPAM
jgi:hypothetical protein